MLDFSIERVEMTEQTESTNMSLDKDTVELIAKAAADEAVSSFKKEVLADIKSEIENSFKAHFGDMSPFDHANQHSRIDKLLNSLDKISDNFWGQLITGVVKWVFAILVVAYFMSGNVKIPS